MKLPWAARRQARLDMQLDVSRIVDYLSDTFQLLGDIHYELRALNEQLGSVPAGQLAAIAAMARTAPMQGGRGGGGGGNTVEWGGHRFDGTDCPCMDPAAPAAEPKPTRKGAR